VLPIHPQEGLLFNGPVAAFTDSAGAGPIGNYAASIDWGDGSAPTAGSITQSGSTFTVSGSHTYSEEGGWMARPESSKGVGGQPGSFRTPFEDSEAVK
jgi:hypothetical protein